MALKLFGIESLAELDGGKVAAQLAAEIRRAVQDCESRPTDETKRQVQLKIAIAPVHDGDGGLDSVWIDFEIVSRLPKRKSKAYSMAPKAKTGGLVFNSDSPASVHQMTLDETSGRQMPSDTEPPPNDADGPADGKTASAGE